MKNSMLVESLSLFWQQRVPRERWMLSLALLTIVCALIYVIGINPALSGKQSFTKSHTAIKTASRRNGFNE